MKPPLLLPVPRAIELERGCFVITEATRICLMFDCSDAESETAQELAEAIKKYAECEIFVESLPSNRIPSGCIGLRLAPEESGETPRPSLPPRRSSTLGDLLKDAGLASSSMIKDIEDALPNETGMTLRKAVVSTGLIREEEILDALAQETGMEKVSLHEINVTPELLSAVDPRIAQTYRVFPVRVSENMVHLALGDPLNTELIEDLERILGKEVVGMVAPEDEIFNAIRRYYGEGSNSTPEQRPTEEPKKKETESTSGEASLGLAEKDQVPECCSTIPFHSHQTYSLWIGPDRVEVIATAGAGLFYGVQTLIQLVRQYGRRLPALRIEDQPDFPYRGFLLDVSRGRVPTLDTLKWLVHTLSHFKINMLQLYVEHTFHFESHPEIGEGCSPLAPEEILELDRYCKSRHVELVPSLQSFGHMGYILSLPEFRHLAEIAQFKDWKRASWPKRLHGMTITPVDERTYKLLADLYRDFLCNFTSVYFNVNSDETWDLGQGRSRKVAKRIGVGRLYLYHIERLAALARQHGRRPMMWADIVHQHPDLIPEVPDDIILLDWGYSHDSPFERCEQLAEAKRPFFVCPGTSGWNQVFNDVWNATRNIRGFVAAGKRSGAMGVLNTDWGDCGHFNMIGCSLHSAVLGAAMSWNEGRPDDETFDRAFSLQAFDDPKAVIGHAIRRAGSLIREKTKKGLKTWELWASPIKECRPGREISPEAAKSMSETLYDLIEALAYCPRAVHHRDALSWLEISLGVHLLDSLVMRAQADHERLGLTRTRKKEDNATYSLWLEFVTPQVRAFKNDWKIRSRPSNLDDILRVFRKQIRDARARAR